MFLIGALMAFAPDHLTDIAGALLIAAAIAIGELSRSKGETVTARGSARQ